MPERGFASAGYAQIPGVLGDAECAAISDHLRLTRNGAAGTRSLLSHPWCVALARRLQSPGPLSRLIPADFIAGQCTYFEKSASRNWLVAPHQDLSIPVAERIADPSMRGWSEKEGMLFVLAPLEILEKIVIVRLHLDACTATDGPLRVVAGSHLRGRISEQELVDDRLASATVCCVAERGDALVLRPLLLHASSKASGASKRRVLQFLFGPRQLPSGLRWHHTA